MLYTGLVPVVPGLEEQLVRVVPIHVLIGVPFEFAEMFRSNPIATLYHYNNLQRERY